jgi:hypothetical protein
VGLEQGPLSLVSTIEELLERKSSCSGLENREGTNRADHTTPLKLQKLELTLPTSGGRLVSIARSRTQATEDATDNPSDSPWCGGLSRGHHTD